MQLNDTLSWMQGGGVTATSLKIDSFVEFPEDGEHLILIDFTLYRPDYDVEPQGQKPKPLETPNRFSTRLSSFCVQYA